MFYILYKYFIKYEDICPQYWIKLRKKSHALVTI